MTDTLDGFLTIALLAFVEVSREQQDWPDSETTKKRAYDEYESRNKAKHINAQS